MYSYIQNADSWGQGGRGYFTLSRRYNIADPDGGLKLKRRIKGEWVAQKLTKGERR